MKRTNVIEHNFNFFNSLSTRNSTHRIIIHHTGGADIDASAAQIHQWHLEKGYAGIGYHFVIRKNGNVERGRPLNTIGAHAYGANFDSIGIHLSGDFTFNLPSDSQIESCATLIADLCELYNIPINRSCILGHRDTIATACPGNMLYNLLDVIIDKACWYSDNFQLPTDNPTPKWKPRAGMLSEHFAESEFACPCCNKCEVDPRLIELLESLRFQIGGYPLIIKKGFTCKSYGGAVDFYSQGKMVDVFCPRQLSFEQFKWHCLQLPFDSVDFFPFDNFATLKI